MKFLVNSLLILFKNKSSEFLAQKTSIWCKQKKIGIQQTEMIFQEAF